MAGIFQNGVWTCGFDFFTTATQIFDVVGGAPAIGTASGRFTAPAGAAPSQGILCVNNNHCRKVFGANISSFFVGFALRTNAQSLTQDNVMWFYDNTIGDTQFALSLNANNQLILTSGSTGYPNGTQTVLATGTPVLLPNTYYYVEVSGTISSSGVAQVRLNGSSVITFSGNTQFSTNAFINALAFGQPSGGAGATQHTYDDLYILDTTGAAPLNTFLGDSRIAYWPPTIDSATPGLNAYSTNPSQPAGSHFSNVNAVPNNLGVTYNFDGTVGDRESYRHAAVSVSSNFYCTNTWAMLEKDDANSRSVAITTRSGVTDSIGPTISSPSSYAYFNKIDTVDPATGLPWAGGFANSEVGLKVIA